MSGTSRRPRIPATSPVSSAPIMVRKSGLEASGASPPNRVIGTNGLAVPYLGRRRLGGRLGRALGMTGERDSWAPRPRRRCSGMRGRRARAGLGRRASGGLRQRPAGGCTHGGAVLVGLDRRERLHDRAGGPERGGRDSASGSGARRGAAEWLAEAGVGDNPL